jgi:hypothetical protein
MRHIDKLRQQKAALLDQLEALSDKVANEQRLMTEAEQAKFDQLQAKAELTGWATPPNVLPIAELRGNFAGYEVTGWLGFWLLPERHSTSRTASANFRRRPLPTSSFASASTMRGPSRSAAVPSSQEHYRRPVSSLRQADLYCRH